MSDAMGAVKALWRFPVKSMRGEKVEVADLTQRGLVGDRAYALVDTETGKVMSAKSPRLGQNLLGCRASFIDAPREGDEQPPVRITLPDGTSILGDAADAEAALSELLGRPVTLERAAPEDFTIDQYHPDIEDLDPAGHRDTVTETRLGSAFFAEAGLPSAVPVGAFFDLFPVSVLTTSTLDRLNELRPETRFDERRFRMNIIVDTHEPGFLENDWIGRGLHVGDTVRLDVAIPDPRCVMTTLAQDELPQDREVLRTLARQNRIEVAGGLYPCAGVYATVSSAGRIREGDAVWLA
ncbi:MAG: MOSC domain-containing protein [Acidimicrobiales bacterium]